MKKFLQLFPGSTNKRESIRPIVFPQPFSQQNPPQFRRQAVTTQHVSRPITPIRVSTTNTSNSNQQFNQHRGQVNIHEQRRRTGGSLNLTPKLELQKQHYIQSIKPYLEPADFHIAKQYVMLYFDKKIDRNMLTKKIHELKNTIRNRQYYYSHKINQIGQVWKEKFEKIRMQLYPADFFKFFEHFFVRGYLKKKLDLTKMQVILENYCLLPYNQMYFKWKQKLNSDPEMILSQRRFQMCTTDLQHKEFQRDPKNQRYLRHITTEYQKIGKVRDKVKSLKRSRESKLNRESKKRKLLREKENELVEVKEVEDLEKEITKAYEDNMKALAQLKEELKIK